MREMTGLVASARLALWPKAQQIMSQPESIVDAFTPLLPQVLEEEIPMLIAMLERLAADHYRRWAEETSDPIEKAGLMACMDREEEIAIFIESLEANAEARRAELTARLPDLAAIYASIMEGRSRSEQLRIQAEGELGGADYMSSFAAATSGAVAARFASLALCEEANSRFLTTLLDQG
jgi:hypothetical protein